MKIAPSADRTQLVGGARPGGRGVQFTKQLVPWIAITCKRQFSGRLTANQLNDLSHSALSYSSQNDELTRPYAMKPTPQTASGSHPQPSDTMRTSRARPLVPVHASTSALRFKFALLLLGLCLGWNLMSPQALAATASVSIAATDAAAAESGAT